MTVPMLRALVLEGWLLRRERTALVLLGSAALLASVALWLGSSEIAEQRQTLATLLVQDQTTRTRALASQTDYGDAAYYSYHLTYQPPSALAYAALGVRDQLPWKHRIRMLALEGQIYEDDAANPELELGGRFDFAFIAGVIGPLLVILLLYDLHAGEHRAGRHDQLIVTANSAQQPWLARTVLRIGLLWLALLLPLWLSGLQQAVDLPLLLLVGLLLAGYLLVWTVVVLAIARLPLDAATIASVLLGGWLLMAFIVPPAAQRVISQLVPLPRGADIVLQQRETVNAAWDLPKQVTMERFVERHPQWHDLAEVKLPFEWKWYYAFQQVGDQAVETLSRQRLEGLLTRHRLAYLAGLLSPPWLFQQVLSRLAGTDTMAALDYQQQVRAFHAELRAFFYPLLFTPGSYDPAALDRLPRFQPTRKLNLPHQSIVSAQSLPSL